MFVLKIIIISCTALNIGFVAAKCNPDQLVEFQCKDSKCIDGDKVQFRNKLKSHQEVKFVGYNKDKLLIKNTEEELSIEYKKDISFKNINLTGYKTKVYINKNTKLICKLSNQNEEERLNDSNIAQSSTIIDKLNTNNIDNVSDISEITEVGIINQNIDIENLNDEPEANSTDESKESESQNPEYNNNAFIRSEVLNNNSEDDANKDKSKTIGVKNFVTPNSIKTSAIDEKTDYSKKESDNNDTMQSTQSKVSNNDSVKHNSAQLNLQEDSTDQLKVIETNVPENLNKKSVDGCTQENGCTQSMANNMPKNEYESNQQQNKPDTKNFSEKSLPKTTEPGINDKPKPSESIESPNSNQQKNQDPSMSETITIDKKIELDNNETIPILNNNSMDEFNSSQQENNINAISQNITETDNQQDNKLLTSLEQLDESIVSNTDSVKHNSAQLNLQEDLTDQLKVIETTVPGNLNKKSVDGCTQENGCTQSMANNMPKNEYESNQQQNEPDTKSFSEKSLPKITEPGINDKPKPSESIESPNSNQQKNQDPSMSETITIDKKTELDNNETIPILNNNSMDEFNSSQQENNINAISQNITEIDNQQDNKLLTSLEQLDEFLVSNNSAQLNLQEDLTDQLKVIETTVPGNLNKKSVDGCTQENGCTQSMVNNMPKNEYESNQQQNKPDTKNFSEKSLPKTTEPGINDKPKPSESIESPNSNQQKNQDPSMSETITIDKKTELNNNETIPILNNNSMDELNSSQQENINATSQNIIETDNQQDNKLLTSLEQLDEFLVPNNSAQLNLQEDSSDQLKVIETNLPGNLNKKSVDECTQENGCTQSMANNMPKNEYESNQQQNKPDNKPEDKSIPGFEPISFVASFGHPDTCIGVNCLTVKKNTVKIIQPQSLNIVPKEVNSDETSHSTKTSQTIEQSSVEISYSDHIINWLSLPTLNSIDFLWNMLGDYSSKYNDKYPDESLVNEKMFEHEEHINYANRCFIVVVIVTLCFQLCYFIYQKLTCNNHLLTLLAAKDQSLLIVEKELSLLKEQSVGNIKSIETMSEIETLNEHLAKSEDIISTQELRIEKLEQEVEELTESGMEMHALLSSALESSSKNNDKYNNLKEKLVDSQNLVTTLTKKNFNNTAELEKKTNIIKTLRITVDELTNNNNCLAENNARISSQIEQTLSKHQLRESKLLDDITSLKFELDKQTNALITAENEVLLSKESLQEILTQKYNMTDAKKNISVVKLSAELKSAKQIGERYKKKLDESLQSNQEYLDQIDILKSNIVNLEKKYSQLEVNNEESLNKLNILTTFFKEQEKEYLNQINEKSMLYDNIEGKSSDLNERLKSLNQEITNYKSEIQSLKKEIIDQEASYKIQISAETKKANDHWLSFRQAERKIKEMEFETAQLRNKLTMVDKKLENGTKSVDSSKDFEDELLDIPLPIISPEFTLLDFEPPPPIVSPTSLQHTPVDQRLPPLGALGQASSPPVPISRRHNRSLSPGSSPPPPRSSLFRPLPQRYNYIKSQNSLGHSTESLDK